VAEGKSFLPMSVLVVIGGAIGAAIGSGGGRNGAGFAAGLLLGAGAGALISLAARRRGG
jgi:hypothetical protein